jgi:prepilin peptidase CpaA
MSALPIVPMFCVLYVLCIWSDVTSLLIPNWISILLVAGFIPFAVMRMEPTGLLHHFAVAFAVFSVSVVFFILGWMGGGDVKFLTATSLWMGADDIVAFLFKIALIGGAVALFLIYFRLHANAWRGWGARYALLGRILELAERAKCLAGSRSAAPRFGRPLIYSHLDLRSQSNPTALLSIAEHWPQH